MSIDEIYKEAKDLSPDSQIILAEMLMQNLDSKVSDEIKESHVHAVEARMKDTEGWVSAEDVISSARNLLK